MSVASPPSSSNFIEAIEHLPMGTSLFVEGVSWDNYEQLLSDLGDSSRVRVFFDNGRMEIMAPAKAHEIPKSIIHSLVICLRDEMDIDIESIGSTTLRRVFLEKGAEPDDAFYVGNVEAALSDEELDLDKDPPPDIVVEVDRTSGSLDKFSIYAGLGVPEIWRVRNNIIKFYTLNENQYVESQTSLAFPFLTTETLEHYAALSQEQGSRRGSKAFREWLKNSARV